MTTALTVRPVDVVHIDPDPDADADAEPEGITLSETPSARSRLALARLHTISVALLAVLEDAPDLLDPADLDDVAHAVEHLADELAGLVDGLAAGADPARLG